MASNKHIVPKEEVLDFRLPPDGMYSRHVGVSGASSSGSNIRTFFIDMGFLPSLVDKVIEEKGEDDVELLLNTLTTYSAEQKSIPESSGSLDGLPSGKKRGNPPNLAAICHKQAVRTSKSESSDSLDSLFDDKDASNEITSDVIPKEEADDYDGSNDTNRASLLMMNFTVDEVNFAMDKLGGDAPINELVDFIIAAQIAENLEQETDDETFCRNELKKEESEENDETLFVTMEKTLRLLEMGFSENEVSLAIEKFGSDNQVSELADSIVTGRIAGDYPGNVKCSPNSYWIGGLHAPVKAEESISAGVSPSKNVNIEEILKGKRPKEEHMDDLPNPISRFDAKLKGKRPKPEYDDDLSSLYGAEWEEAKFNPKITRFDMLPPSRLSLDKMVAKPPSSPPLRLNPSRTLDKVVAKPPFFLYGNVLDVTRDSWEKVSKFLYAIEPEFVDTRFFSALSRREGYVHNLPFENRSHILPKPPMTIEDAIPRTKKWWPSWDTRKHLSCINSETRGIPQLCERLTKTLTDSRGKLSAQQQRDILHHCIALNLIWVGQFKLAPVEPEHLERVLGYPVNHTQDAESSSMERLQILKYCFQTDTLGYHLSVLKSMFPEGLTVLSIFSGIGGAEIALHRLGIHLKVVISVESSAAKRRVLQNWWRSSGQTGLLEQIEDIQKLTSNKLHNLIKKHGGFDLVVCQNPCSRCLSSSKLLSGDTEGIAASFDFSIFYEFVRVLQGVRNTMERKK